MFVSIVRGHVASSKGNILCAAIMWLNVQPDVCAIICGFPKSNMVSHALLHIHSNTSPGATAALQVLRAVRFMADIAWQVKHSISRRSPSLSQTDKCAVQCMQVIQCISLDISTVEPAMHVPENTGELNAVTPFFLGHPLRGWPRQLCLWHRQCLGWGLRQWPRRRWRRASGGRTGIHCPFHIIRTSPWKHTVCLSFLRPR